MSLRSRHLPLVLAFVVLTSIPAMADGPREAAAAAGPLIEAFGPTYPVDEPDIALPKRHEWKLVFDVARSPEDPAARNPRIETVARFLNMHAKAGVPRERMQLTLVVHGGAGKDLLQDAAYRARFGTYNPNDELLRELVRNGVEVVLCGQTAAHRKLLRDELEPDVKVALSAMTVLALRQAEGYALIAF